jgi:hypothetical protein
VVVDLEKYIVNRPIVQNWYLHNNKMYKDIEAVAIMAVSTGCPCICVAYWIGEINGWSPAILDNIGSITKFYGYVKILGRPANSPI